MNFSFQTILIGAVVTVAHLVAILAIKPATLEASKFFENLELDGFVQNVLVKQGRDFSAPVEVEESIPPVLAGIEEILSEPSAPLIDEIEAPKIEAPEKFMNLQEEMDSMKAVTDVRVFAGRIDEPKLEEYTSARVVAEPVADPVIDPVVEPAIEARPSVVENTVPVPAPKVEVKKESPTPAAGPHRLRAITPISRP